jgi:hypothetical protein
MSVAAHGTIDAEKKHFFYSIRIGVVDVGWPTGQTIEDLPSGKEQVELFERLKGIDEFGPQSVAAVKDAKFRESVGRGLAYLALHEFWHVAELTDEHPYQGGNRYIESDPKPTAEGLQFQTAALTNMLTSYEKTWCKYLGQKRISL